jgi:hypothetical protein
LVYGGLCAGGLRLFGGLPLGAAEQKID